MKSNRFGLMCAAALVLPVFGWGCAGGEKAIVGIRYVLQPDKGLPRGFKTLSVSEAKVHTTEDAIWSEKAADRIESLLNEARDRYGASVELAARTHLQEGMDESDLDAARLTNSSSRGMGGQVVAVDGLLKSDINVKIEKHTGKDTTVSAVDVGRMWRGSWHGSVQTREVDTVTRNITVETSFELVDKATNQTWLKMSPESYRWKDKTKADILFGSSKTEAELTPRDELIGFAVEQGARAFVSRLVPCQMSYAMEVESSGNKSCAQGVRLLRSDSFGEALSYFKMAIAESASDDRAYYGAGVACEAMGDYKQALAFYKQAVGAKFDPKYDDAKKRLSRDLDRIKVQ